MTTGQTLLDLQQIDLELSRREHDLNALLQLTEVKKLRSQLLQLKSAHTQARARVKDIEFEIEDFEDALKKTQEQVTLAQEDATRVSDYRQVQDVENELSMLAKRLDKLAFDQKGAEARLETAMAEEDELAQKVTQTENILRDKAQDVRDDAAALKVEFDKAKKKRAHIASQLPQEMLTRYEAALKKYKGLAVEKLEGEVPSICRMNLNEAMIRDISRQGSITECPSCHRILVIDPTLED